MVEKEIRFVDLFAGIGGFHLGLTEATKEGWQSGQLGRGQQCTDAEGNGENEQRAESAFRCIWANEWDKYAASIYKKRFPETPFVSGDIREVEADSIPDHDLLCAGFPCQAFSVAGKRRGFEEARGTLFYEIARIAERKRPRLLLLENVKGLLSHDKGQTFGTILEVLGSLGYWCEWQVLNSKWFGVPQNRERVFIIGHLGEEPARTIFPITETGGESNIGDSEKQVASTLQSPGHANGNYRGMNMVQIGNLYENKADAGRVYSTEGVARTLKGESGGLGGKMGLYEIQPLKFLNRNQRNFEDTAMTVDTVNSTGIRVMGKDYSNSLDSSGYLRSGGHHPAGHRRAFAECRIRRLTPVECERLQGFPDGFTEGISDTQRYKCLGNAVTVNVIRFLGERILSVCAVGKKTS